MTTTQAKTKKPCSQAAMNAVLQTLIAAERPLRLWEIVQANRKHSSTTGLQKAARELEKQGKLEVTRDKDGNLYCLKRDFANVKNSSNEPAQDSTTELTYE